MRINEKSHKGTAFFELTKYFAEKVQKKYFLY